MLISKSQNDMYMYVLIIGHVEEYPTMHDFGIPRLSQSMIAYKILSFDCVFLGNPIKNCIVWSLLSCHHTVGCHVLMTAVISWILLSVISTCVIARFVSVPCPSPGCTSMVPRRLLDEHLTQCEHRVKECPKGCGELFVDQGLDIYGQCCVTGCDNWAQYDAVRTPGFSFFWPFMIAQGVGQ